MSAEAILRDQHTVLPDADAVHQSLLSGLLSHIGLRDPDRHDQRQPGSAGRGRGPAPSVRVCWNSNDGETVEGSLRQSFEHVAPTGRLVVYGFARMLKASWRFQPCISTRCAISTPDNCAMASTISTPGMMGVPGKWPWKNGSLASRSRT